MFQEKHPRVFKRIKSFRFDPIPFDSLEIVEITPDGDTIACGRFFYGDNCYEDYGTGLEEAFQALKLPLKLSGWNTDREFQLFLSMSVDRYILRIPVPQ